ncbi:MarR family winged helix-turn-helix transcriptional regulator [Azospirillum sp. sgz302134]
MELFRIFTEIAIIDQLMQNEAERLLAPDLNMSQFAVLKHLVRNGDGVPLVSIAQAMQVTKGAMTNTIGRLAEKGLVAVEPDPLDKRGKRVVLTATGLDAHRRALTLLGDRFDPIKAAIPSPTLTQARETLTTIRCWLDANR